ncbi:putative membrane protein [Serratia plymuthica A30]|nr:putative membrane protein [Serratia plymuthica A30]
MCCICFVCNVLWKFAHIYILNHLLIIMKHYWVLGIIFFLD